MSLDPSELTADELKLRLLRTELLSSEKKLEGATSLTSVQNAKLLGLKGHGKTGDQVLRERTMDRIFSGIPTHLHALSLQTETTAELLPRNSLGEFARFDFDNIYTTSALSKTTGKNRRNPNAIDVRDSLSQHMVLHVGAHLKV